MVNGGQTEGLVMSGTIPITCGGAFNGHTGVVTIPSSLLFGFASTAGSINSLLQTYLGDVSKGLVTGLDNFENNDLVGGPNFIAAGTPGGGATFEEFTNTDSVGGTLAGGGNYPNASVTAGVSDLVVQTPGNVTLAGVGTTTKAVFGANSNVNYSVTNPAAGEIDLLGGANSITLYSTTLNNAETVYSAGADTINLIGQGTDYVTVLGNAVVQDEAGNANVVAEGSATTNLYWDNANAGGTLHFTNNSSVAATIHIGNFNGQTSSTKVTAYGGVGGGFFVGGSSGSNSLVGGAGVVTLVGAGPGDFLEANSSIGTNVFAAGSGNETMIASSTTGSNVFGAGLNYPGLGNPQASGVISTDGSGNQSFLMGNVPGGESVYGSTVASATNTYFVVSDATAGGGLYSIYNFINSSSTIFLSNGAGGPGSASITGMIADPLHSGQYDIALSDGTTIQLKGLSSSEIGGVHTISAFGITGIVG